MTGQHARPKSCEQKGPLFSSIIAERTSVEEFIGVALSMIFWGAHNEANRSHQVLFSRGTIVSPGRAPGQPRVTRATGKRTNSSRQMILGVKPSILLYAVGKHSRSLTSM